MADAVLSRVHPVLVQLNFPHAVRVKEQSILSRTPLRLDVLHFLFGAVAPDVLALFLPFSDKPSESDPHHAAQYLTGTVSPCCRIVGSSGGRVPAHLWMV